MKWILFLLLSAQLTGSTSFAPMDKYIGKWQWVKSDFTNRGGGGTTNQTTTTYTAMVEITSDFKLKHFENGILICEGDFILHENDEHVHFSAPENCSLGAARLNKDTLIFYKYLGCPSITNYYIKTHE
jgi:hypothetical protein